MNNQANLGSVFIDLRLNTSNIAKDAAMAKGQVEQQLGGIGKATSAASKSTSALSGVFSSLGKGLLGGFGIGVGIMGIQAATQALTGTFTTMIQSAAHFEQAMANINTVLGASPAGLKAFADGIKEIAKNSPTSVDDLGAAAYDIVSAGITDTAMALDVLQASQKLAVSGLGTTKQAVDIMTSAINAYGISADQAAAVSNIFYNAVNYGKTTVEGLAQGFGGMVPIAAQAGITFEEVGAAVGSLTASGKSASEVYTGLEAAASALLKPNEDMIKVFDKLGAQTGLDLVKKFGGLKGAYTEIIKTSKALGISTAEVTGRKEAQSTVTALLTTASKMYDDQLKANLEGINNIDAAYQIQLETTENVYKRYKNQLSVILITLGEKILPLLVKALGFVIDKIYDLYQYGRIIANGFTFVAKGIAAVVASLTTGVKVMIKNVVNGAVNMINGLLGGLRKLGNKVTDALGLGEIPEFKIDFQMGGAEDDMKGLFATLDALAADASKDIDDVGDAASKIGTKKSLAGIEQLGEAFGKIRQQVAEVDPEFERAGKKGEEAKKKAEESIKVFGDLSKALQESIQDRLKFFATEEQNSDRLNGLLSDNKIGVTELSAAWKEAMGNINKQMQELKDNHAKVGTALDELVTLAKSYGKAGTDSGKAIYTSYDQLNKALDATKTKITDILSQLKQIDDQTAANAETYRTDVIQAIVDAEEKIKELRSDLSKESSQEKPDSDRINDIQNEINEQQKILDYSKQKQLGDEKELAEERKKRSMNRLELIQYEYEQEAKLLTDRKTKLLAELTEQLAIVEDARTQEATLYSDMQSGIIKLEEELSAAYQKNLNDRIAATVAFVNKADAEYKRLASIVAAANALQMQRLGLPSAATPPSYPGAPTPTTAPAGTAGATNNVTINAQVTNEADWSQVGQVMGWQLRGAQ